MDTKNLYVNQTIKNYKELCKILDIPILNGNSKIAQLKKCNQYFSFKQQNNKYIIKEIFEQPISQKPNKSKGSPFQKLNEFIICQLLLNNFNDEEGQLVFTLNQLAEQVGYVNENFKNIYFSKNEIAIKNNISKNTVMEFYDRSIESYRRILKTTLKNLEQQGIIAVEEVYFCIESVENTVISNETIRNEYEDEHEEVSGKIFFDKRYRQATEYEINESLKIKNKILNEMGFNSIKDIYINRKEQIYFKLLKRQLFEKLHIYNIYKTYKMYYIYNYMDKKVNELKEQIKEVNNLFYNKIINNRKKEIKKFPKNPVEDTEYIEGYEKLCDTYIKLS